MTNFASTSDFIVKSIPALIAGTKKMHVLVATYNTVTGYEENGIVETNAEGLTVQVQNGHLRYSPIVMACLLAPDRRISDLAAEAMEEQGREAQQGVVKSLKIDACEECQLIAVVYAGLSAFNEAVAMARQIKADNSKAKVVVTTCDCDLRHKEPVLVPMLNSKEIEAVVVTHACGGRDMMSKILEGFVEAWSNRATPTEAIPVS